MTFSGATSIYVPPASIFLESREEGEPSSQHPTLRIYLLIRERQQEKRSPGEEVRPCQGIRPGLPGLQLLQGFLAPACAWKCSAPQAAALPWSPGFLAFTVAGAGRELEAPPLLRHRTFSDYGWEGEAGTPPLSRQEIETCFFRSSDYTSRCP